MRTRLTEKVVRRLKAPTPTHKQVAVWDSVTPGFGVLLSGKTAHKTYVAQRDLPNGNARRVTIGNVAELSLAEARAFAGEAIRAIRRGEDPKASGTENLTLAEAVDVYIDRKRSKLRPRTAALYRDTLRYLRKWSKTPLREITPKMVDAQHAELGKECGEAAANNAMRVLRAVYNGVAREASMPPNPVRLGDRWFSLARREGRVKGDDLARFYAAMCVLPNQVQADYLRLLLFTGLRRTEASTLRWEDVDFANGVIRLPAARTKAGRRFDVPISDLVAEVLVPRRAIGGEWIFPSNSKSGHIEEPKMPLGLIAKTTGISVSAHDLRRTYLSVAERCVSGVALKALANHALADRDVTEGYIGIEPREVAQAAQVVADRLRELCSIPRPSGANVSGLRR